jgi:hypothetical protein
MQFVPRVSSSAGVYRVLFAERLPGIESTAEPRLPALQRLDGDAHPASVWQVERLIES